MSNHKSFYDSYADEAANRPIAKFKLEDEPNDPEVIKNLIFDELLLDGNSKQNLATFCQTDLDSNVRAIMDKCIDKNMIDKDEYPQTAEIENRCVNMIADLWNSPTPTDTIGCSTNGSSEAAMLGGLALKWKWRDQMKKKGKSTEKPNLVCSSVQVCWHKFALYFDVELREIPMEHGRFLMTPEEVIKRCDENTIGVVPTLGQTFTLQYEDVKAVSDALDQLQKDTGLDIPIHVDAASGGFVAPFIQRDVVWDFRLPRVKSINASSHKYGLAPLGCGFVVWREKTDLPNELIFEVDYLGGLMKTFTINFSRPGGQIISQYYNFLRHGRNGYAHIHKSCLNTGIYIGQQLSQLGYFDLIYDGTNGLPGVAYTLKKDSNLPFSLYALSDRLRSRGWTIASYSLPNNCKDIVVQRILVRHGFSRDLGQLLVDDIVRSIEYLKIHPPQDLGTPSFHH